MCISSGQQLNKDSIKFFLSTHIRRVIKLSQAKLLQCIFLKNKQFITWGTQADHGKYKVPT